MTHTGGVHSWCMGIMFPMILGEHLTRNVIGLTSPKLERTGERQRQLCLAS